MLIQRAVSIALAALFIMPAGTRNPALKLTLIITVGGDFRADGRIISLRLLADISGLVNCQYRTVTSEGTGREKD